MRATQRSPLVSVILPTYNRAHTLLRAVNSVLNQGYREIELIVVDDASTDGTAALLEGIADLRLRIIRHDRNKGVATARNTGIFCASGQLIAFQDSDDEWLHGKVEKQLDKIEGAGQDCVLVYCTKIIYGRDEKRKRGRRRIACVPPPDETELRGDMREVMSRTTSISPQTMLIRRDALLKIGGFDERIYGSEEWDLAFRLAQLGTFEFVDEPLVNTYLQPDSISNINPRAAYSLLIIYNKMKRAGVPNSIQAQRWASLGNSLARMGHPARGDKLLRAAIAARPLSIGIWARFIASILLWRIRRGSQYGSL